MNDIIVGVDRSSTARRAAETAASLAAACDGTLHLITCVKDGTDYDAAPSDRPGNFGSIAEAEQFLRVLEGELPHARIVRSVELGDPATSMCEKAVQVGADVIVVGNRRVQGTSRVLGSIAATTTRQAPCHVLVANTTCS